MPTFAILQLQDEKSRAMEAALLLSESILYNIVN